MVTSPLYFCLADSISYVFFILVVYMGNLRNLQYFHRGINKNSSILQDDELICTVLYFS